MDATREFLFNSFQKFLSENNDVKEYNVYICRMTFGSIVQYGKPVFNRLELIFLQMLLTDSDTLNRLYLDFEFIKDFINMPQNGEDSFIVEFNKECLERIY